MSSALIVSASAAATEKLAVWLGPDTECSSAGTVTEAKARLAARPFDLLLVNAPLPDGDGEALCTRGGPGALLLVPQARYAETCARMQPLGVLTLPKPVSAVLVPQAIALLRAARAQVGQIQGKLEEVRVVERAKWTLMSTLQMTEPQAHRYIEKQAMNLRQTRRTVAERIIQTYENERR